MRSHFVDRRTALPRNSFGLTSKGVGRRVVSAELRDLDGGRSSELLGRFDCSGRFSLRRRYEGQSPATVRHEGRL